jgi:hypothetical protein
MFTCNTFTNYASRFALKGNANNLNDRYWCSENPPAVYLEVPLQYKEGLWYGYFMLYNAMANMENFSMATLQNVFKCCGLPDHKIVSMRKSFVEDTDRRNLCQQPTAFSSTFHGKSSAACPEIFSAGARHA